MKEENYEYLKIHLRHIHENDSDKNESTNTKEYTRYIEDSKNITHASMQGWEIKAVTLFTNKNLEMEVFHMQRSSLHPNFGAESFTDEYFERVKAETDQYLKGVKKYG